MEDAIEDKLALFQKIDSFNASMTNEEILSDQESGLAREIVTDMEGELYRLDQESSRLRIKREDIATRLSTLRITLAPHKRLPTEILAEIFVCASAGSSIELPLTHKPLQWLLCAVCSRWRKVAFSEPRLWNEVSVNVDKISADRLPKVASILTTVLACAGLSSFTLTQSDDIWSQTPSSPISDILIIPNLSRVTMIDLHIPISTFSRLLNASPTSLVSPECMILNLQNPNNIYDYTHQFANASVFRNARNLRVLELTFDGHMVRSATLNLPIPWNQLTSLDIGYISPIMLRDLLHVLRESYWLESFYVSFFDEDSSLTDPIGSGDLHLPHLRHVTLHGSFHRSDLFTYLRLPWHLLTSLDVESDTPINAAIYHILRKCVRAEELAIMSFFDPLEFKDVRHGTFPFPLPHLTHLDLHIFNSSVFDRFTLPALISLQLYNGDNLFPTTAISNMILRSECSLSTLIYRGVPYCGDYPSFVRFLSLIPAVNKLSIDGLVLDAVILHSLITGKIFPQLKTLSCGLEIVSLPQVINALEIRAKVEAAGGTRVSILGYIECDEGSFEIVECLKRRIKQLNADYKTKFDLQHRS